MAEDTAKKTVGRRLLSVDVLRGFDMFFISGGGLFIVQLEGKTGMRWVDAVAQQMEHTAWHGLFFIFSIIKRYFSRFERSGSCFA